MSQKTFASRGWLWPTSSRPIHRVSLFLLIIFVAVSLPAVRRPLLATGAFTAPVTVVSAASYGSTLTPDSIASAFGEKLATQTLAASGDADPNTPGIQLPTELGGTTVEIGGQRAGLFFVSPGQVNFVIPPSATSGEPIVQLTPLGVRLSPGGRLTFPNTDNLAANSQAKLYRLDQISGSPTLSQFVEAGAAQVSADGRTIATAPNAIAETSYYFVAIPRPTTTLVGRVLDSDGTTPAGEAFVRSRGQSASTDSLGGFVLRGVPASEATDLLTVEASYQRPGGRVDRVQRNGIAPVLNGVTRVTPDLVLPSPITAPNRPPALITPPSLSVTEGSTLNYGFLASDPDANQMIQVSVSGAAFATVSQVSGSSWNLRLAPNAGAAGNYTLTITATDNLGASTTRSITLTVKQAAQWAQTAGPEGGIVQSLLVNGTTVFAGTYEGGVFRSTNNGQSWTAVNNGLMNLAVSTITGVFAFAASGNNLFAGTNGYGVFLSTDSGQSWVNTSLTGQIVNTLMVSGGNLFAGTFNGIFLSTNNGQSWAPINNGLTNLDVRAIAVSGGNLFAGTFSGGVFRSTNNGQSWASVTPGSLQVFALAVTGAGLFAGTSNGILLSTDNGQSWGPFNNGLPQSPPGVYAFAVSGVNLFAGTTSGVFLLAGGQSWTPVNSGLADLRVQAVAAGGGNLFAGTLGGGIFRSSNNGQSWTSANTGLTGLSILNLTASGGNLFAGTNLGGVFRSADNGQSWTASSSGLTDSRVRTMVASGANLFAGTDSGVFISVNQGQNWTPVNNGLTSQIIFALAANSGNLFAGTLFGGGVFRSTNNGQNWAPVNNGLLNRDVYALAVSGATLFAGTGNGSVFRSSDNGQSWVPTSITGPSNTIVPALGVSGSSVFATTFNGVLRSTDNGQTWTPAGNGLTAFVNSFAASSATIFAGAVRNGVFFSNDNGQSWAPINSGLTNPDVRTLAVLGNRLFAGTNGSSVFVTQF